MSVQLNAIADGTITLRLKVVPGSSRDRIVGVLGDELKIAVSKPPEGGAANKAVLALLAKVLGIPKTQIRLISGQTNPHKQVAIRGLGIETIRMKLSLD